MPFSPGDFLDLSPEEAEYARAAAVILPVPYERTTTYRKGTAEGPAALLAASGQMETWDQVLEEEVWLRGLHTHPGLESAEPPEVFAETVAVEAGRLLANGKLVGALGGEHSISLGLVRAHRDRWPGLHVLHLDAHGDLRDHYEGTSYGHGCVMRRVAAIAPIVQVGVRSVSPEEAAFLRETDRVQTFWAHRLRRDPEAVEAILERLGPEVYVSIDLDVFDPSEVPGVGTPEPGGMGWYEVTELLERVAARRRIVGFDLVELCPIEGTNQSEFLAARLAYRLIGLALRHADRDRRGAAREDGGRRRTG